MEGFGVVLGIVIGVFFFTWLKVKIFGNSSKNESTSVSVPAKVSPTITSCPLTKSENKLFNDRAISVAERLYNYLPFDSDSFSLCQKCEECAFVFMLIWSRCVLPYQNKQFARLVFNTLTIEMSSRLSEHYSFSLQDAFSQLVASASHYERLILDGSSLLELIKAFMERSKITSYTNNSSDHHPAFIQEFFEKDFQYLYKLYSSPSFDKGVPDMDDISNGTWTDWL